MITATSRIYVKEPASVLLERTDGSKCFLVQAIANKKLIASTQCVVIEMTPMLHQEGVTMVSCFEEGVATDGSLRGFRASFFTGTGATVEIMTLDGRKVATLEDDGSTLYTDVEVMPDWIEEGANEVKEAQS